MTGLSVAGRRHVVVFVCVAIVAASFTLYLRTANPIFRFSDGPELATASFLLGVAHPTGYPIYLLCQKLWGFLMPIGNPCFRANLFGALCAATTAALIYLLCLKIAGPLAGVVAAGLLASSKTFWLQATQSTVYSLNLVLGAALMLIAFRVLPAFADHQARTSAERQPGRVATCNLQPTTCNRALAVQPVLRSAALFFFTLGIGLGNHLTLVVFALALALSHPRTFSRILNRKGVALAAVLFLLFGALAYVYLPIRAQTKPALNWDNPSIWERFWGHVSQRDYKFKQASRTFGENLSVTASFFGSIVSELGIVGTFLALLGLWGCLAKRRGPAILLMLLVLGTLVVALSYGQGTELESAYCLPAYLAGAILAGCGAWALVALLQKSRTSEAENPRQKLVLAVSIALVMFAICLAAANYHVCDNSDNYFAYWHGQNLLKTMPRASTFFGETDTALFPLYYLKFVEGYRDDVKLYDRQWRVVEFFEQNDPQSNYNREMRIVERATGPVFYAEHPTVPAINIKLFGILLEAFMVDPITTTVDFLAMYSNFLLEPPKEVYIDKWTRETRAKYFLLWGHQTQLQDDLVKARAYFGKARSLGSENAGLLNNLSIYYQQAGMLNDAIEAMERAVELEPRNARFLTRLGILYFRAEKLDKAVSALTRSLAIDPAKEDTTVCLGNAYLVMSDLARAEEYFKRTLEIVPHHVHALNNLGFIYRNQRKYDEAIAQFKEALQIDPTSHLPYFNLAVVCALKGDREGALDWLKRGRRHMSQQFVESIRTLREFDSIRGDPRFDEILSSAR